MLKKLIYDLAHENITLSQGLTRGKLIGAQIKNDTFKNWVTQELSGYDIHTDSLPHYRKIKSRLHFSFRINGGEQDVPIEIPSNQTVLYDAIEYYRVFEPISSIESNLEIISSPTVACYSDKKRSNAVFAAIECLNSRFTDYKPYFSSIFQEVTKTQFREVIETAKQTFLDILLNLDEEFPDLSDRFYLTREKVQAINNIINNYISGNNSPLTLAVGQEVNQQSSTILQKIC